jgi:hypothetical protein
MAIGTGSVGIEDDGSLTPGSNGFALGWYLQKKATADTFTAANGGTVAPDAERVLELKYYALEATNESVVLCPHLV